MLSPSTAPRWKRQTSVGRSDGRSVGRRNAYAARARKRGSRPTLTSASPPAFTNTRLLIVMVAFPSDGPTVRLSHASLPLELRSADRQPDRQRAGLEGITDGRYLMSDDCPCVLRHDAAQHPGVGLRDQ